MPDARDRAGLGHTAPARLQLLAPTLAARAEHPRQVGRRDDDSRPRGREQPARACRGARPCGSRAPLAAACHDLHPTAAVGELRFAVAVGGGCDPFAQFARIAVGVGAEFVDRRVVRSHWQRRAAGPLDDLHAHLGLSLASAAPRSAPRLLARVRAVRTASALAATRPAGASTGAFATRPSATRGCGHGPQRPAQRQRPRGTSNGVQITAPREVRRAERAWINGSARPANCRAERCDARRAQQLVGALQTTAHGRTRHAQARRWPPASSSK